mgnify:CR=1 FL=1
MDPFTAISMGVSVAGSVGKMISGFEAKKQAMEDMKRLQAQPLPQNAYDALQVPMRGFELQQEAMQRQATQAVEMMQQAGTRAIAGGIGQVSEAMIQGAAQAGAAMDQQMYQRDIMRADEAANIEGVKEARYAAQTQAAAEMSAQGTRDMFAGAGELASLGQSIGHGRTMDQIQETGDDKPLSYKDRHGETRMQTLLGEKPFSSEGKIGGLFQKEGLFGKAFGFLGSIFKKG